MTRSITIEVAPGELIDKLTILDIKLARIEDAGKRVNVAAEHAVLREAKDASIPSTPELIALTAQLRSVNEALWDIEDHIRDCERRGDFGEAFVALARSVYKTNDRRAALKKDINQQLGSRLTEEKSYQEY